MKWLERHTIEGNSPVNENGFALSESLREYFDKRNRRRNPGGLTPKAKYSPRSIVNQYREGKVKSSPMRAVK